MRLTAPKRLLLGPQRPDVDLGDVMQRSGFVDDEPVAVISAGWQEAEGDIDDIRSVVKNPLTDVPIYKRTEALLATDKTLQESYRTRQDQLKEQQRLYRLRLRRLAAAARELLRMDSDAAITAERSHAISQLRALDRHHVKQIRKINARFDNVFDGANNSAVADAVAEIHELLSRFETVLITGGHIVVLLNRLRLFKLEALLTRRNIVSWSGGAMALCDRIVLFHDHLPQGRRDPEVMCEGLGVVTSTVLLPDAKGRLRQKDLVRNSLFSRRFSPSACLTLDNGAHLLLKGTKVIASEGVHHLSREGSLDLVHVK